MKIKTIMFSLLLATITFSSCKKYDEGPSISLRSRSARVAGDWTLESYTRNGQDITALLVLGGFKSWEFTKDGDYTMKYNDAADNETGKWEFTDDDEKIKITVKGASTSSSATILKLKDKSMWLEIVDGTDKDLFKLKQ